jgi:NAD+--asparagine ADP-ribosyltransferase
MGGRGSGYSKASPGVAVLPSTVKWKRSEALVGANISTVEGSIKSNKSESAAVYVNGNQILFKDGKKNYVQFTTAEVQAMKGGVLTHNHPSGTSFSDADVALISKHKLKEIRAVSTQYTYSLSGKGNGTSAADAIKMYNSESMRIIPIFRQKIMKGEMTVEEATKTHAHEILSTIAPKLGYKYKRTRT